ncbi:nuclear GTPase SLIP-GC-like [Cottoperca gobio]|uniref:Nuclear GTPase SLIP-GC-like n=1 Tax=Cottoperca gobio TaxID=56716 RepID=A0A6J2Q587_COTGO|nr:nuclear GTPase SLIP-GC-like [Cottoperca gobio]
MDDFVRNKLTEWNLSKWTETFKDQGIDKESLYCLGDQEIADLIPTVGPRSKFKKRLKLLKEEQNTTNPETVESSAQCKQEYEEEDVSAQVCPSTSDTSDKVKRKLDLQDESSQSPARKRPHDDIPGSYSEEIILSDVKNIMRCVKQKLPNEDNKLNNFLKYNIRHLETDKREVVGVFGKTGAGKSSLINAVIGVKNLLPSGSISACTTVMIKVEANMHNSKYEAHIEFITKEEWRDEMWSLFNFLQRNVDEENDQEEDQEEDQEDDDGCEDTEEKLSALYGEGWKNKSSENLMDNRYFKEIPEFLQSKKKILTCESAKELSAKCVKYTRSDSEDEDAKDVKRWYWPLVKCVTVKVPNNKLLQHVTLVDLPGNGDRNKSRDQMWKRVVESCSTVWIVTDINRAASEKEPWDILRDASSHMGNGGECQNIHFICTKSDLIEDSDDLSAAGVRAFILKKNEQAKKKVRQEFSKLNQVKKHFSDECFKVFTVSSKEFLRKKRLQQDDTEIPKLQEFLQDLNDWHSETLNYVSRARGILSLMHGASRREGADIKTDVCKDLEEELKQELDKVRKPIEETFQAFEKCLSEGVEKSKSSCEKDLKSVIHPNKSGSAFHSILKCIVVNNGIHKTQKGTQINLNMKLTSCLTDSIDEKFKETFPNEGKRGPFKGVINMFSLGIEKMIREKREYKDVTLQLIFLRIEEEKIKTKLNEIIRERKKMIYSSLTTTIENTMKECYEEAKEIKGRDSLKNMRDTIVKHVHDSKNIMFEQAKDDMLNQLRDLMLEILETLEETMQESIELSLKTEGVSIPDVTVELEMVKNYYNELMGSPDTESLLW